MLQFGIFNCKVVRFWSCPISYESDVAPIYPILFSSRMNCKDVKFVCWFKNKESDYAPF